MAQNYKPERDAREERVRVRGYQARRRVHEHQVKRRSRDNIVAGAGLLVVLALLVGAQVFYFSGGPGAPIASNTASSTAVPTDTATDEPRTLPSPDVAENRTWTGTLTLNDIPLGVELDGALAPQAVASTITLAQDGFYDGVACHRLTTDGFFVLQCGDPAGDASGPGYSYGPIENAPTDNVYPAGTIAMARVGDDAESNGSQFFVVYDDTTIGSDNAGGYTVVGRVTSGLSELKAGITDAGTDDGTTDGGPAVPTSITAFSVQ